MWSMVHNSLIEEIARQLTPKLWPRYKVRPGERVVVSPPDAIERIVTRDRIPDVAVFTTMAGAPASAWHEGDSALSTPIIRELLEAPPSVIQSNVEIRSSENDRLVTIIELLSPSNKRGPGAAEFSVIRREILASETHFLEIDLLRIGERFPVSGPLPSVPYFVFLSRVDLRPRIEIWPIPLEGPLPAIPVPLITPDQDARLDLQLAMQTVYELFHYDADIDYSRPPTLPLDVESTEWAAQRIRDFRPS
jgi:hypothetical protein